MIPTRRGVLAGLAALAAVPAGADPPPIRVAILDYGTVRWELDTIRRLGLDTRHGFALEVQGFAGTNAARVAFLGGAAETTVVDWLWVARQRAAGRDVVFLPYSRAVGGLLVAKDSPARALADLKGRRIGIAGGPLDKGWLILRTVAAEEGLDLAAETDQVFGAPPLLNRQAETGGIDAILTYWHYGARLEAKGFRRLVGIGEAARALGLDPDTPLLGYAFDGALLARDRARVAGFAAASRAAKRALMEDAAWEPLRPEMKAGAAEAEALIRGYREGIPPEGPVDREAAAAMFALMAKLGGDALTGGASTLPDGVFVDL